MSKWLYWLTTAHLSAGDNIPTIFFYFRCMSPNDLETLVTYNTSFQMKFLLKLKLKQPKYRWT